MKNKDLIFSIFLLLLIFIAFIFFYTEVKSIFTFLISSYGIIGIILVVIIMDTIIQPISPDIIVFGATFGGANITTAIIAGLASCLAGSIGYFIGKKIGAKEFRKWFSEKHLIKGKELFDKYGILAIVVGALSPIPYSAICWTAGIYNMKYKHFLLTSLLTRVPRFFLMGLFGYLIGL